MTQEFHLSITSLGSDRYLIRTEDTAPGVPVAEAQVDWPVEEWLERAHPALDNPVVGLLQGSVDLGDRSSSLHQLGGHLYTALFQEESIRESWLRAQGIAQNRNEMLRFRLGLKESRLQRLPWEVLRHGGQPLTTRSNLTFARYIANFLVEQTTEVYDLPDAESPIQVLMVIASPQDQERLKLLQEVRLTQELLAAESETVLPIQIDVLDQPDRSLLAQTLEHGNYQVLHYAGHSDFGSNGGDLSLVNRQTGLTERLSGDDLAGLLVNNHIALTVFNSCRSGHTAADDADIDWRQQNIVQALINRGVPSVIAMAERIPDEVAIAFTRLFYHNLRKGFPIDLSLSRTRQGLFSSFGSDQPYWALPILYLQPDFDGYLSKPRSQEEALLASEADLPDAPPDRDQVDNAIGDSPPEAATESLPEQPADEAAVSAHEESIDQESIDDPTEESVDIPVEPPAVVGATAVLIEHLETTELSDQDEDEALANYVEQLSKISPSKDDPPMPADQEEVLVSHESRRAGMEIYDVLPEVSSYQADGLSSTPTPVPHPVSSRGTYAETAIPQEAFTAANRQSPRRQRRTAEKPLLVWFALGLVGIVGVVGLSVLAMRWTNRGAVPAVTLGSPPAAIPEPASPDPFTLIRMAEEAIAQERYDDAREHFELALTQELLGEAEANTVSDSIWPWVSDTQQPDLLYIKGRIAWQEIARLESDLPSYETRYEQRVFAAQAREAWEQTEDQFLEGRIARGFAEYVTGDLDAAIANWEAALALYDNERQQQPDPTAPPEDPVIVHAYAGLVMAHTKLAGLNPAAIAEDDRLNQADDDETAILTAEADREASLAREYFLRLEELDPYDAFVPGELLAVTASPNTWHNWLWTEELLNDWRRDYRYWDSETNDIEVLE